MALNEMEVLGPEVSLAHSVWLEPGDIEAIAESGAVVAHNPAANLRLASGRAPIVELQDAGATIALGTDGAASSDNQDLWQAAKLAEFIHAESEPGLRANDVLRMAILGGAAALGESERLGSLQPGRLADIILLDLNTPTLAGAQELEPALVLSDCGRSVRHVFVAGQQVVAGGVCTTIDEAEIVGELRDQARIRARERALSSGATREAMKRVDELLRWAHPAEAAAGSGDPPR